MECIWGVVWNICVNIWRPHGTIHGTHVDLTFHYGTCGLCMNIIMLDVYGHTNSVWSTRWKMHWELYGKLYGRQLYPANLVSTQTLGPHT